jgi:hypothetical protein
MGLKKLSAWFILALLSTACEATAMTSAPTPAFPIAWHTQQSPVFPTEWPPTSATKWVRYAFAYGTNLTTLVDGVYVTRPLTRTEVQRDGSAGTATTLSTALGSVGIQGVAPLDATSNATLITGPQVQTQSLPLTALPTAAAAAELRAYYRMWIKLNGAFAQQIRSEHPAFFDWLEADR